MMWRRRVRGACGVGTVIAVIGSQWLGAQEHRNSAAVVPRVSVVVTVTDAAKRPSQVRLVADLRRSHGNERADSAVTDRSGRATLWVLPDQVVTIKAFRSGEARPLWAVVQLTPSAGSLALAATSDTSALTFVRSVHATDAQRGRVNRWLVRVWDEERLNSFPPVDSLHSAAVKEWRVLWQSSLTELERQAVLHGMAKLEGAWMPPARAQLLLRDLNPASAYWLSTPLPGVLMPLIQASRGLSPQRVGPVGRDAYIAAADSIVSQRRARPEVADELLGLAALFAYQTGDSAGAYRRWRAIEGTRPGSPVLPALRATIAPNRPVRAGQPAPAFALDGVRPADGRVTDRSFTARVTLVDLWATWCGPCVAERPVMVKAWADWRSRGFDIMSLGLDDSAAVEQRFLAARPELVWRHGVAASSDGRARRALAEQFGVLGIPRWLLVDANGRVLEEQVTNLDSVLAKYLGRP